MKIALYGATGNIGRRILNEALARGHEVTAVVRDPAKVATQDARLHVARGDIFHADDVASQVAGHDVVISAYGRPDGTGIVSAAESLIAGVQRAKVGRLLAVGGAGSLEAAPGVKVMDAPDFPDAWKGNALAQREALEVYRSSTIDWTYLSPAAHIQAGERTGKYRTGTEQLVVDERGESQISYEDYAVAMLDEIEHPNFIRKRFTAAY